jgi:hypothetical protein
METIFLSYALNSTRFALQKTSKPTFASCNISSNGLMTQPWYACAGTDLIAEWGWLPGWVHKTTTTIPMLSLVIVLSVCTENERKELEGLNGWMRGRMSLITCVKEYCFDFLCWRLDSMDRCFSAVVFFLTKQSRNSPVAPTGSSTFIHVYHLTIIHFDVAVSIFVPLDGSRETYCWLLVVSR